MIKKAIWLLSILLFVTSCISSDDEPTTVTPDKDTVTILAYMIANNNLNDELLDNTACMYAGLASMKEPATLLIYWDGSSSIGDNKSTHLILEYTTDGKGRINGKPVLNVNASTRDILNVANILKEYPTQTCTDKDVMKTVLQDMISLTPTDRVGLIIGSHGSSWLNTISTSGRALGYDGSTSNSITLTDMVEAVESIEKKLDFLLFDACYMGNIEVCYEFRNVSDYIIASVMEVPSYGFPYEYVMDDLFESNVNAYKNVCKSFIAFYEDIYKNGNSYETAWGTVALVDCNEVANLVSRFKEEIISHKGVLANYHVGDIQEYGREGGKYIAYDLQHFIKNLNNGEVPATFEEQLNKTVLYKGCLEESRCFTYNYDVDAENFCGLGLYIPLSSRPKWNTYFKTLDWYTASGWNEVSFSWNF